MNKKILRKQKQSIAKQKNNPNGRTKVEALALDNVKRLVSKRKINTVSSDEADDIVSNQLKKPRKAANQIQILNKSASKDEESDEIDDGVKEVGLYLILIYIQYNTANS